MRMSLTIPALVALLAVGGGQMPYVQAQALGVTPDVQEADALLDADQLPAAAPDDPEGMRRARTATGQLADALWEVGRRAEAVREYERALDLPRRTPADRDFQAHPQAAVVRAQHGRDPRG